MPENYQRNIPQPTISVDTFVYAMLEDDAVDPPLYGSVKTLPGLVKIGWNPDIQVSVFPADGGAYSTVAQIGSPVLTADIANLTPEIKADWYGFGYENGMLEVDSIERKYMAVGYRVEQSDGSFDYRWIYKCQPSLPGEDAQTKGGGALNQQGATVTFNAVLAQIDGKARLRREMNDKDKNLPSTLTPEVIKAKFFTDPLWDGQAT